MAHQLRSSPTPDPGLPALGRHDHLWLLADGTGLHAPFGRVVTEEGTGRVCCFPQNGFWGFMENFDINKAGFVIVGMFIVTWAVALLVWRYGHIEEKWGARLKGPGGPETPLSPPWAGAEASD